MKIVKCKDYEKKEEKKLLLEDLEPSDVFRYKNYHPGAIFMRTERASSSLAMCLVDGTGPCNRCFSGRFYTNRGAEVELVEAGLAIAEV